MGKNVSMRYFQELESLVQRMAAYPPMRQFLERGRGPRCPNCHTGEGLFTPQNWHPLMGAPRGTHCGICGGVYQTHELEQ